MSKQAAQRTFAPGPAAPGDARRFVAEQLGAWGRSDLSDQAAIAISEVVTNAYLHGHGEITLTITLEDVLRIAVHDAGTGLPSVRRYSSSATTGRGLHLVGSLSDRWGTTPDATGKWVWFELDATHPSPQGPRPHDRAARERAAEPGGEGCEGPLAEDSAGNEAAGAPPSGARGGAGSPRRFGAAA